MKTKALWIAAMGLAAGMIAAEDPADPGEGWARAVPPGDYQFPRDHYSHPDFKTEWWYFTGHLRAEGRDFGFQATIFRQGIRPAGERGETDSKLIVDHLYFAHLALSDIEGGEIHFSQETARGSFGEAGASTSPADGRRLAWLGENAVALTEDGQGFELDAAGEDWELDLTLLPEKPPVFNGIDGCSQKGEGLGNASHYYSYTRLAAEGTVTVGGKTMEADGLAWFDREWSTSALGDDQVGWDWFSLQFDDGSELMLYQLRREDGSASPFSSGQLVPAEGDPLHLTSEDFSLRPARRWRSETTGGNYPVDWEVVVPSLELSLKVGAEFDHQELALQPVAYWEGAVKVAGSKTGRGYLEMTGYAGPLGELR